MAYRRGKGLRENLEPNLELYLEVLLFLVLNYFRNPQRSGIFCYYNYNSRFDDLTLVPQYAALCSKEPWFHRYLLRRPGRMLRVIGTGQRLGLFLIFAS